MTEEEIKNMDIEKIAFAIEQDAEQALPGLRESWGEMQRGEYAAVHAMREWMQARPAA